MFKAIKRFIISIVATCSLVPIIAIVLLLSMSKSEVDGKESQNCDSNATLTSNVTRLKSKIVASMEKKKIESSYLVWILALLQQESGGRGSDPFQASESKCGKIGCISNVDESIDAGLNAFKNRISRIKKLGLNATPETILQSYNYGTGYLDFLAKNKLKEYSASSAKEFSKKMCGTAGTSPSTGVNIDKLACYGDYNYIIHVKRYINTKSCSLVLESDGKFVSPYDKGKRVYMTQKYANKSVMYKNSGGVHIGIDFDGGHGARIHAITSGKVHQVQNTNTGYGSMVMIKSNKSLYTIYAHMIAGSIKVSEGENVSTGQVIGKQGSTGFSTGSHLHLELRKNGNQIQSLRMTYNPKQFLDWTKFAKRF